MSGINLRTQVRRILRPRHGGTGTARGWARGNLKVCINRTGSSLALGTLVRLTHQFGDPRVEPTTTYQETTVLGVVVGWFDQDTDPDTLIEADSPAGTCQVGVLVAGTTDVLIGSEGATKGQYAYASTTDGRAASSSTLAVGAFGIFQSGGSSGDRATIVLSGAVQLGAGSVSYGTPALVFGTAAAAGSASTAVRTDATLALFDATTPAALTLGGSGATGSAGKAARRDHGHAITGALDDLSDVATSAAATGDHLVRSGSSWVPESPAAAANIWRPVMDGYGNVITDGGTGEAIMAYGPA